MWSWVIYLCGIHLDISRALAINTTVRTDSYSGPDKSVYPSSGKSPVHAHLWTHTNPLWSAAIIICGLALPGDTCAFKACKGHPVTTFGLKVPWSPRAYIGTHFGVALCPQVFYGPSTRHYTTGTVGHRSYTLNKRVGLRVTA